jgi:5-methylcytosine-specific restriction endonuclease McrA
MEIITRDEAIKRGMSYYFTGEPCAKRGHVSKRVVSSYSCFECRKEMLEGKAKANGVVPWSKTEEERRARRKATLKKYAEKNKEKVKVSQQKFKERNPNRAKQIKDEWRKRQPKEYFRLKSHRRRATVVGSVSKGIAKKLLELQKHRCAVCKVKIEEKYEIDHIVPLAKGGAHADDNLQLLCPFCNRSKGALDPLEYMQSKGYLL